MAPLEEQTPSDALVPIDMDKTHVVRFYEQMQLAISNCHSIDDCKEIGDQAAAIAAYYKQIKDDQSVRKLMEIKVRAWRRIGEILIEVGERGKDESQTAYARRVRKALGTQVISEAQAYQAIKIARIPKEDFEDLAGEGLTTYNIVYAYESLLREAWERSPEGQRELKARQEEAKALEIDRKKFEIESRKACEEQWAEEEAKEAELNELMTARDEAFKEVGVTMDRRDRKKMRQVVLLIKEEIHSVLRQAAFDNHMTMQAILRDGLAMWFITHGYADIGGLVSPQHRKTAGHK